MLFLDHKKDLSSKHDFLIKFKYLDPFNLTTFSFIKLSLKVVSPREVLTSPQRKLPNFNKMCYVTLCVTCTIKGNRPTPFQKHSYSCYRGRQTIHTDGIWKSLMLYHILAYYLIIIQDGSLKPCQKTSCKCIYGETSIICNWVITTEKNKI